MNCRESLIKLIDRLSDTAVERVRRLAEYLYVHKGEVRCGMSEEWNKENDRLVSEYRAKLESEAEE